MMNFPQELHIRVFDHDSGTGVANLAMKLTLFAPRKNNYVIPLVTNSSGEVHLSASHVRESIKDDWELFPMDYASSLEQCSANVEIKVCSTEDVIRSIEAMKMFKSASTISDELLLGFEQCVNDQYVQAVRRFNVEETDDLTIAISRDHRKEIGLI